MDEKYNKNSKNLTQIKQNHIKIKENNKENIVFRTTKRF